MRDKLLLLVGNWLVIEADGETAIFAAVLITGGLGLLSILAIFIRPVRNNTSNTDLRK
jgi:hypothetical protein